MTGENTDAIRRAFYDPDQDIGHFMTVAELARVIKMSGGAIRELIRDGQLPAFRTGADGGTYRILREDAIAYLIGNRTTTTDTDAPTTSSGV